MRLQDVFKTPSMVKVLDLLLAKPSATYLQSDITGRLGIDKATMRRAIERLQALDLINIDVDPAGVHIKAITFNGDSKAGRAPKTPQNAKEDLDGLSSLLRRYPR
jgi:predicted ArsR family transcriptional regulator